eukprot:m51a1_g10505 hypothetical protein (1148) ;mRNA; r:152225-157758
MPDEWDQTASVAAAHVKQEFPGSESFHSVCALSTLGLEDMPAPRSDHLRTIDVRISDSKFSSGEVLVIWGDTDDLSVSYPYGSRVEHAYVRAGSFKPVVMVRSALGRIYALEHSVNFTVASLPPFDNETDFDEPPVLSASISGDMVAVSVELPQLYPSRWDFVMATASIHSGYSIPEGSLVVAGVSGAVTSVTDVTPIGTAADGVQRWRMHAKLSGSMCTITPSDGFMLSFTLASQETATTSGRTEGTIRASLGHVESRCSINGTAAVDGEQSTFSGATESNATLWFGVGETVHVRDTVFGGLCAGTNAVKVVSVDVAGKAVRSSRGSVNVFPGTAGTAGMEYAAESCGGPDAAGQQVCFRMKLDSSIVAPGQELTIVATVTEAPRRVIVQLEDPPAGLTRSDRSSAARAIQDRFLGSVKRNGLELSESLLERGARREARFTTVLNAVAVNVPSGTDDVGHVVERMRSLPGVVNAWPDAQHRQTLFASGPLVGLPAAWGELLPRRAGEGVKVAVVDGGTSKDVPMMSGAGFAWPHDIPAPGRGETDNCNAKLVVSRFYADPDDPPAADSAHSWPGPRDSSHGVQAAGGNTVEILQALEDAIHDGAQVVSNSWGGGAKEDSTSPISVFCQRASVQHNVVFVFSAGNNGPNMTTVDHPETNSIRVAASTTTKKSWRGLVTRPAWQTLFPNVSVSAMEVNIEMPAQATLGWMTAVAPQVNNSFACRKLEGRNYRGRAVVVHRGSCRTQAKLDNVAAAGAAAMIVVHNDEQLSGDTFSKISGLALMGIGNTGGSLLLHMLQSYQELHFTFDLFSKPDTQDVVVSFSSRGPSTDMTIGPDVAAPGFKIVAQGYGTGDGAQKHFGFGAVSGTSMACPHVSGIAALIRQRHPEFTAAEVKSALMTTSSIDVALNAKHTVMASPLDTGAGRVVASAALDPTVFMQPQALSFSVVEVEKRHQLALAIKAYTALPNVSLSFVPIAGSALYNTTHLSFSVSPATVDAMAAGQTTTFSVTFMGSANQDYVAHLMVRSNGAVVGHAPVWARAVLPRAEDVLIVDLDGSSCHSGIPDVSHVYQEAFAGAGFSTRVMDHNCSGEFVFPEDLLFGSFKAVAVVTGSLPYKGLPNLAMSVWQMTALTNQGTALENSILLSPRPT